MELLQQNIKWISSSTSPEVQLSSIGHQTYTYTKCISVSFHSLLSLYDDTHNLVKLIEVITVDRRLVTKDGLITS